jgi:hypothetical protein
MPLPRPAPLFERIKALIEAERHAEVLALCDEHIARSTNESTLWNARGISLRALNRVNEAIPALWKAVSLDLNAPASWSNLGNALKDGKQLAQSIAAHRRAVTLSPGDAGLHHNLGIALHQNLQHAEAIAAYDCGLAIEPGRRAIRWDRALSALHLGHLAEGWADYEIRTSMPDLMPPRAVPGRPWDGAPLAGRRLLVLSEQGFGDALWVARYLPRLRTLGGEVILEARPELIALFEHQGIADGFVRKGDPLPPADFHVHQCSLPRLFAESQHSISGEPYLRADPARVARLAPHFAATAALKVGIVWSGSLTFKGNHDRAQPLGRLLKALWLPGVRLYSLQMGPCARDLEQVMAARPPLSDLTPHLRDFADTAAALRHLDLVVMTDSAVAHLAGALGTPVWLLLNRLPHFLWSSAYDATPWYDTVRLFRAPAWHAWDTVYDVAAEALLDLALRHAAGRGGRRPGATREGGLQR